jgi:hypothetical protein
MINNYLCIARRTRYNASTRGHPHSYDEFCSSLVHNWQLGGDGHGRACVGIERGKGIISHYFSS